MGKVAALVIPSNARKVLVKGKFQGWIEFVALSPTLNCDRIKTPFNCSQLDESIEVLLEMRVFNPEDSK